MSLQITCKSTWFEQFAQCCCTARSPTLCDKRIGVKWTPEILNSVTFKDWSRRPTARVFILTSFDLYSFSPFLWNRISISSSGLASSSAGYCLPWKWHWIIIKKRNNPQAHFLFSSDPFCPLHKNCWINFCESWYKGWAGGRKKTNHTLELICIRGRSQDFFYFL